MKLEVASVTKSGGGSHVGTTCPLCACSVRLMQSLKVAKWLCQKAGSTLPNRPCNIFRLLASSYLIWVKCYLCCQFPENGWITHLAFVLLSREVLNKWTELLMAWKCGYAHQWCVTTYGCHLQSLCNVLRPASCPELHCIWQMFRPGFIKICCN